MQIQWMSLLCSESKKNVCNVSLVITVTDKSLMTNKVFNCNLHYLQHSDII